MCSPPPVPVPAGVFSERRDWTWHDTPEQIAAAMLRLYPDKAKRLGSTLQNAAKSTTRKPRTPAAKQRDDSQTAISG